MSRLWFVALVLLGAVATIISLPDRRLDSTLSSFTGIGDRERRTTVCEEKLRSDDEWREFLSDEQYYVLRRKGTERAFTGRFYKHKAEGIYICAGCGNELFSSETKYESGSGWPSYYAPIGNGNVITESDMSYGMVREEVMCARCGGHLGHVFDDGPQPTGLRYCINSAALDFVPKDSAKVKD